LPVLIDPPIHYKTAETEPAFTYLFGGFANEFYASYLAVHPFEDGLNDRIKIYNLYPLLVHLNLLGSSYYSAIHKAIKQFSK
jgi:fructosamine-3-kinase